ncbi:MAG TPA: signal recognition particle-docking protein FtsY, partial [Flavitalea sp.]|nr:signal recognition particle-docking protein FtsY [Flavitalea sp.]
KAVAGKSTVDEEVLDNLEDALVSADVGVDTTIEIINKIEARVARDKYLNVAELNGILKEEIEQLLVDAPASNSYAFDSDLPTTPYIILVVGVNGVGKTTTIGKLAHNFKQAGKNVLLGAADTFRAAAVEQLTIWSERVGVPIIKQDMGSDPAAVAFDTAQSAVAKGSEVVLIDTAGRLHNKAHLMEELSKIKRVIQKVIPDAPHEVLLVLDGSTGQNALEQAKHFTASTDVTALAITKLDGTAKGGVVLAIANQFKIPVKFIGVGEKMTDLLVFDKHEFVDSLFKLENR